MMRIRFIATCLCFLVIPGFLFLSCRKKDKEAPVVELYFPSQDTIIHAGEEIRVDDIASDNENLGELILTLIDSSQVIQGSESFPLSSKTAPFRAPFIVGNRFTPSGKYTLNANVTDEAGNLSATHRSIEIIEVPTQFIQAFFGVKELANNDYKLWSADSNQIATYQGSTDPALVAIGCDNRNNQLITVSSLPGKIRGLNPQNPSEQLFLYFETNGALAESFSGISIQGNRYATSLLTPPFIRIFNSEGILISNFNSVSYPANSILQKDDLIWVGQTSSNGVVKKMDGYSFTSGNQVFSYNTNWPVSGIFSSGEGTIVAWGNDGPVGKIIMFDASTHNLVNSVSLAEPISGACAGETETYFITSSGLYKLGYSSQTPQLLATGNAFYSVNYLNVKNSIYVGGSGNVQLFYPSGALFGQINGLGGEVRIISFEMNK